MTGRRAIATITDIDGNILSDGLQTCDMCDVAIQSAYRRAEERGEDVILYDADGDWRVTPAGDATSI